jgi:integrase/recombinase XerD
MDQLAKAMGLVNAGPREGCSKAGTRELLKEFFETEAIKKRKRYIWKFGNYAEFLGVPRTTWPHALEQFFAMKAGQVEPHIQRYNSWLKLHKPSCSGKSGSEGHGLYKLTVLAKMRNVIAWSLRKSSQRRHDEAWAKVDGEFRDKINEWLEFVRHKGRTRSTIVTKRIAIRHFGEWLKERRLKYQRVDYQIACGYMDWLFSQKQWTNAWRRAQLEQPRLFYRWLHNTGRIPENPFLEVGPIRPEERIPKCLSEADMLKLIGASRSSIETLVVEFLYATGCRVGEMCALDLSHISIPNREARVVGKGARERVLLFNKATAKAIAHHLPNRQHLQRSVGLTGEVAFLTNQLGRRLADHCVQRMLKVLGKRAGLSTLVHPHLLRHSFATHMLNRGADLFTLMHLMGHRSIQATMRYLKSATGRHAEVYRRCHPRK